MRKVRRAVTALAAGSSLCWAVLLAGAAWAQTAPPPPPSPNLPPGTHPLLVRLPAEPPTSTRPLLRLSGEQMARLREAQNFRASGLHERARGVLQELDRAVPHHPLVLGELAGVHVDLQDWSAVERLARVERSATKDSLLLGREYTLALERLGRPRDAIEVVLEMWIAEPTEAEWANASIQRLVPADPKGARETVRKIVARQPQRPDLQRALARVEWQSGNQEATLKALAAADRAGQRPSWRARFAEELLATGTARDTTGALEALTALAADRTQVVPERLQGMRRAWDVACRRGGGESTWAPRLYQALSDVPPAQWQPDLVVGLARGLRGAGRTREARELLQARSADAVTDQTVHLERALLDLREGPPESALPALATASRTSLEASFRFAEALFYAGLIDSALGRYQETAKEPASPYAGAALERIYLIEEASPRSALPAFGKMAYEEWRGNGPAALAIADSLSRTLPRGPLWAQATLSLSHKLEAAGDVKGALASTLAIADSLPEDRLAPLARQRAGDLYLERLKDEAKALAQYEECLARYPRAWNAAEVRRRVEVLRREKRF